MQIQISIVFRNNSEHVLILFSKTASKIPWKSQEIDSLWRIFLKLSSKSGWLIPILCHQTAAARKFSSLYSVLKLQEKN